ncbi:PREDICTED: protein angel homolog 2-like isoform X2 [Cyprinodon variegatus]|uniref:protein angel homolog 2-like isoform X2 n=1 Tax=Cyprinodon variegatus TaxID=28743 RepID=UPI000742B894|nr:PREDICTED: protein angel homolog 2-like isoform X2 [Cyprinodon variegatus]
MHNHRNNRDFSPPMFLRRLTYFRSSYHPRGCRAFSNQPSTPASHLCRSVQRFPPWPPRLPPPRPPDHPIFTGSTFHPFTIPPGRFSAAGLQSLHTSVGLMMERPNREPPNKRRKSVEEGRSGEEKDRGGRETRSKAKERESKQEHHHLHFRGDDRKPENQFVRIRDKPKSEQERVCWRESSREKADERTKGERKGSRDESLNQHSRNPPPKSTSRQDPVPAQRSNPWFKGRSAEELGRLQGKQTGSAEHQMVGGVGPEGWPELPSQPSTQAPNQWQPERPAVRCLQRQWETCSTEPRPPGDSRVFDFSVMSYNILSQELLQDNAYLYRHCDPTVLPWQYRLPNLLAEIQKYNADILCLQEVQEDHYENQIKPALHALGYQCEYKKRTGKKPDGCAVIFKTSRFSLLSSTPVEFYRPGDALLDRDNVGMVVLLQPNAAAAQSDQSSFVCVANTHLLYNPRRGDIKLAQLAILLAEIGRLSRLPDGSRNPVVLCGDFNSAPWSPLYRFLTTGCLEYQGMQIGLVSGQETSPKGHRVLTSPIWSRSLGISQQCQYESRQAKAPSPSSPTAVDGGMSNLTVDDPASRSSAEFNSSRIEHKLRLQSSYGHRLMPDGRPEITTCHSRTALTVDYILYSSDGNATPSLPGGRGLQLLGRLSLVGQSELEEVSGLPNGHHSSDHLPLLARFRLHC